MKSSGYLYDEAVKLLNELISIPSVSREENQTADCIENFLKAHQKDTQRKFNNVWSTCDNCHKDAPVLLLNSHHDTVKASGNWSADPCQPVTKRDQLFGLGSNDAGASVVSLMAAYLYLSNLPKLPYRLIIALTGEEEISGTKGISSILKDIGPIDLAVVGEPTDMQMAIAEKGLVVLDCHSEGKAGHAAREEGINAIYQALEDIEFIRNNTLPQISPILGPVKMTVSQIKAGHQHNVVPASCEFVVDVRTNELYSNQEVVQFIQQNINATVRPRSTRLNSSSIDQNHPIVRRGLQLGCSYFGSPTLSDQSLMDFTSIKIGPGKSSRSHTVDEFILLPEINQGIETYIKLLTDLKIESI